MKKKKRTAKEKSTSPEVGLMNVLKDEETGTESQSCEDKEMHASCREEVCDLGSFILLKTCKESSYIISSFWWDNFDHWLQ